MKASPDPAAEIISRYFDGDPSPEDDAALAALLASDPGAAAAFVSTARLDAMLQRQMPRRQTPVVWKWIAAGSAAALATAAALAFIPRTPTSADDGVVAGDHWQPVETANVPLQGISMWAARTWEYYHRADPESFVPLPELKVERWEIIPKDDRDYLSVKVAASYPENWRRKESQARQGTVESDGTISLGNGLTASVKSLSLASPVWPESRRAPHSIYGSKGYFWTTPVYFDHLGRRTADQPSIPAGEEPLIMQQWLTASTLGLDLRLPSGSGARILGLHVFDAATRADLTRGQQQIQSAPAGTDVQSIQAEAFLSSDSPVRIVVELGVPMIEQQWSVSPVSGSRASGSTAEAKVLGSLEGVWHRGTYGSSPGMRGGTEEREVPFNGRLDGKNYPDKSRSCTFLLSLPPGLEADVSVRTAGGLVPSMDLDDSWSENSFSALWSFAAPLASVEEVVIRPLQRHRIALTVAMPRDPWNGLNMAVTDALEIRMPDISAETDEARIAVSTFLGIDESLTYIHHPPLLQWPFAPGPVLKNPGMREILLQVGKTQGRVMEIEPSARLLRVRPAPNVH